MKSEKTEKLVSMTEDQLEQLIKMSIKDAMNELREEKSLIDEKSSNILDTPATFSLLYFVSFFILLILGVFSIAVIIASITLMIQQQQNILAYITILIFAIIVLAISVSLCVEINKTKKMEVLNTIFSAVMALSTLLVAIVSAYFAYLSIGGGAA